MPRLWTRRPRASELSDVLKEILFAALACAVASTAAADPPRPAVDPLYVIDDYYPGHDPRADLALAVERAAAENKRILLVVGGDWCVWCHILDRFLAQDEVAHAEMAATFVIVKVNMSRENENEDFLAAYPTPEGYPDFIVLASDGRYLASQNTEVLEEGRSYSRDRMIAFARRWRVS
jgi:thiol:disulfide interchange protein